MDVIAKYFPTRQEPQFVEGERYRHPELGLCELDNKGDSIWVTHREGFAAVEKRDLTVIELLAVSTDIEPGDKVIHVSGYRSICERIEKPYLYHKTDGFAGNNMRHQFYKYIGKICRKDWFKDDEEFLVSVTPMVPVNPNISAEEAVEDGKVKCYHIVGEVLNANPSEILPVIFNDIPHAGIREFDCKVVHLETQEGGGFFTTLPVSPKKEGFEPMASVTWEKKEDYTVFLIKDDAGNYHRMQIPHRMEEEIKTAKNAAIDMGIAIQDPDEEMKSLLREAMNFASNIWWLVFTGDFCEKCVYTSYNESFRLRSTPKCKMVRMNNKTHAIEINLDDIREYGDMAIYVMCLWGCVRRFHKMADTQKAEMNTDAHVLRLLLDAGYKHHEIASGFIEVLKNYPTSHNLRRIEALYKQMNDSKEEPKPTV